MCIRTRTRINKFVRDENAVSEIIGEILMTAIAVLAFSIIAVFVFSYMDAGEKVHANIDGWVDVDTDTIYIRHSGGETIDLEQTKIILNLNGTRQDLPLSQFEHVLGNSWYLGQTIIINTNDEWGTTISENDYVGIILLQTDSNAVINSGSLLGEEMGMGSGSGGSGNTSEEQQAPFADFIYSPLNPGTYEPVVFADQSSDSDGTVVGWSWNFGDGETSVSQNPTHQYSVAGNYTITFTVTDDDGNTNSSSQDVTIVSPSGIFANQITLNKPSKGGVIKDGGYISFTNDGNYRYIDIDSTRYNLDQNDNIKLEIVNDQTTGTISMNTGNSQISSFDLNANLYINDVLQDTGQVTSIYVQPISNYYSTLIYELSSHNSLAYLKADGDVVINWEANDSAINISNIGFYGSGNTQINFAPSSTYVKCSGHYQISSSEQPEEPSFLPVSWWKFNENSGTIAVDSVGGYDGDIYQATRTTGVNGTALEFDGSNDRVEINERIVDDYPFTISVWLKTTDSGTVQAVVNLADSDLSNSYYGIDVRSNGKVRLVARNTQSRTITGDVLNDGEWYNVVAVFNSSTDRKLYLNGIINGTQSTEVTFNSGADRWSIGRWGDSSPNRYFEGSIDEVKLWDKALDSAEILQLYAESVPETLPVEEVPLNPVSRWRFDENSGSIAYDSVGSNDAQLINAQWSNTAINETAIRFDGNGDYLAVSDDNSLDFDHNMSVLFWLRLNTNNDVSIIGKGQNDQDNFELFAGNGELYLEWDNSGSNYVQTTGMDLQTNTWYQIGVVVDGSNVDFYKDSTFIEDHSMNGVPLVPNNNELWIGRQNYGGNNYYLEGYLDEVELYNVTLSESDIADYYTRTNP